MRVRSLYRLLVRLHPRPFRDRFETEMLLVFADAATKNREVWLIADAMRSLFRQWVLRPHSSTGMAESSAVMLSHGTPAFAIIEDARPRPMALLFGGLLSVVMFAVVILASQSGFGTTLRYAFVGTGLVHSSWGWALADFRPLESPAGQRLTQWLDAYNTGDAATMRQFASLHVANPPKDQTGFGHYAEIWMKEFERFGPFQLLSVHQPHGDRIIGVVRNRSGDWLRIHVYVSSDDRHKVWDLKVESLTEIAR
jgi:hypothetical protein